MALRTSTQSGDWSDTATWGGSAAPGDGDQAIIAHNVAVDANVTVGTSPPQTPTTAPTINLATGASPTNLPTGVYRYNYTFVGTDGKESPKFWTATASASITNGSSQPRITLPANPTGVASKNLYLTNTSGADGTERLYATGITGTTVDLISASWMDASDTYANATPVPNNNAILVSGGNLTIESGVTLTVRGDCVLSNRVLTLDAGASYVFDSSAAATTFIYKIIAGTTTNQTTTNVVCNGSSGSHCTIGKAASSGNGMITRFLSNFSAPSQMTATYTDFSDLGADGAVGITVDGIYLHLASTQAANFDHCTFTRCSRVIIDASNAAADINITFNRFRDAIGTGSVKYLLWLANAATPTGDRIVTDNDFYDRDYAVVFSGRDEGYTFDRNVFAVITYSAMVGAGGIASCKNNIRISRVAGSNNAMSLGSPGTLVEDCYCIWDTATEGRGWGLGLISSGTGGTITVDGLITEGTCANEDSDAFNVGGSPSAAVTLAITGMLVLPNSRGLMSGAITAHGGANLTIEVEHSTLMSSQGSGSATGDAAIYLGSGYAGHANFLNKCRSNLVWNKATPSADGWISWDATSTVDDVINVSQTDNNATFNCRDGTVYDTAGANGVTVRGYHNFDLSDQTIGATDITLSGSDETSGGPKFVDSSRNLATFDSAYLGNTPTAWADATGYVVGDMVAASDADFYNGATINYRCVTAHTSNAANATNGKPGDVASYRTNWEFASAYRIREAIIANTLITDASLGLTNANYVATLSAWVKAGFAVQEVALKDAGHDGVTIGAVEFFSGGGGTFTAEAALSMAAATFAGEATFAPGTKTATAALTNDAATFAAEATFEPPVFEATAELTTDAATFSAEATVASNEFIAEAALTTSATTFDAEATFAPGTKTATADLTTDGAQFAGSATHEPPEFTATAPLTTDAAVFAGAASFEADSFTAIAPLTTAAAAFAASAQFTAGTKTASASLVTAATTMFASAEYTPPGFLPPVADHILLRITSKPAILCRVGAA